jgi:hypothetical protein
MSMMQITNEDGVVCEVPVPQLERGSTDGFLRLLSHKNIKTVERNHPDEFIGIMRDVEALKARTGLPFSSDESRRLTALSILVSKGVVKETLPVPPKRRRRRKTKEVPPA